MNGKQNKIDHQSKNTSLLAKDVKDGFPEKVTLKLYSETQEELV